MINRQIQLSLVAATVSAALTGCNVSNEKGLDEVDNITKVDTSLVCSYPETIKVDSFGNTILDENGSQQCERVELVCAGQEYNPILHACEAKGRHPKAPLERADAIPANVEGEGEKFATLFFWREGLTVEKDVIGDGVDDLIIHAWNSEDCNAYDPTYIEGEGASQDPENGEYWGTDWATGIKPDGLDENYGVFWTFRLVENHTDCFNFIIHEGSTKTPVEENMRGYIDDRNPDRMSYVAVGSTNQPVASLHPYHSEPDDPTDGVRQINPQLATHWFDTNVVLYNNEEAQSIRLYYSDSMPKLFPGEGYRGVDYIEFVRNEGALTEEQKNRALSYRDGMTPFTTTAVDPDKAVDPELAKDMLQGRVVAIALDANGDMIAGNLVNTGGVLDALYTMGDADADEAKLGITYEGDNVTASVWAPTAMNVTLKLYNDKNAAGEYTSAGDHKMTFDKTTGIWTYQGTRAELDRKLFRYEVNVFHHLNDEFVTHEVIDPYAVSLTTNARYARFVDLNDDDLKPDNWDDHSIPAAGTPEDIVVYEGHIRDFSILDESTPAEHRGKYLAFAQQDTAPVNHLKELAEAGITHFQVLPANDIASVNEDVSQRIEIHNTVGDLCAVHSKAQVCSFANEGVVIKDLLETYDPLSERGRQLLNDLKGFDGFNWGYDPQAYNAPEGSYASNPEDTSRIVEMRTMIQSLHEMGLRTSLDVVYNHTSSSGLWDNSVLDKIVPGYYHRRDIATGDVLGETCCQDTAAEHVMFGKLMTDTLVSWSANYKFDAFRFDLMNFLPKDSILAAREAVKAVDADAHFYGEGWNYGVVATTGGTQANMAGTEVSTFSDVQRDGVRSAAFFNTDGEANDVDQIRIGLAANIASYVLKASTGSFGEASSHNKPGQALDPADTVNYVDKHDNETLWDQLQYNLPAGLSAYERTRIHAVAGSFPLLSQGIPFLQMGSDLLRSKSMDRDTYNSGDWLNKVDFTKNSNNWGVSLPLVVSDDNRAKELLANSNIRVSNSEIELASDLYQEFLKIRKSSHLFRLTTAEQIKDRLGFHNVGANQTHGVIVMSIDDGAGCLNSVQDFEGNCDETVDGNMRADLDPNFDAMVVVFNGTNIEQTMRIPTAEGFTLHTVQQNSADSVTTGASFTADNSDGLFTVPAYTTAVFAKVQTGAQGTGLNALATVGNPDASAIDKPTYGETTVYIRGDVNETIWSTDDPMLYVGNNTYVTSIYLTAKAEAYQFKFASDDWNTVNYGAGSNSTVTLGTGSALDGSGNAHLTIVEDGHYLFMVDASNAAKPVVTVSKETLPYSGTAVYLRGFNDDWGTSNQFTYFGNGYYAFDTTATENTQFKIAEESWGNVNFGAATESSFTNFGQPLALTHGGASPNSVLNVNAPVDLKFIFHVSDESSNTATVTVVDTKEYGL
ncbi:alpha-1,6-glucosidase domain-containing protein [Catenovulum sediminis]|uniref:Alpha-1,6-glucosidase domain-containing protein n=1 Tax=Catenovulum sediminis TaxID=1740262 RepID=A0ABV1RF16_9ALTE|nr:alpha-1,6-glucosidase domain-containing protein [Catenovulum sediminis]